jgi:hypothetical protein
MRITFAVLYDYWLGDASGSLGVSECWLDRNLDNVTVASTDQTVRRFDL